MAFVDTDQGSFIGFFRKLNKIRFYEVTFFYNQQQKPKISRRFTFKLKPSPSLASFGNFRCRRFSFAFRRDFGTGRTFFRDSVSAFVSRELVFVLDEVGVVGVGPGHHGAAGSPGNEGKRG